MDLVSSCTNTRVLSFQVRRNFADVAREVSPVDGVAVVTSHFSFDTSICKVK
jgi:hypothetical protein